jgi:hypothetical protein
VEGWFFHAFSARFLLPNIELGSNARENNPILSKQPTKSCGPL